jgi:hypothetical protein
MPSPLGFTLHITSTSVFFLAYIIQTENGYGFLSIERRVVCFLVHRQKGYETFHPPTWELWGCFKSLNRRLCLVVTSERTLVTGNNFGAPVPQLLGAPKSFPITSIL